MLAPAASAADFQAAATAALAGLRLVAVEFEDIEPLAERVRDHGPLDEDLMELAEQVRHADHVCFGTFHTYPHEEA